ncbi:MAG TPA: tetratricopeptide repeat protein [Thermoanaerobaculia bacterium]|nr:tetratricopeptide repeat protein [Thermoanaerobaculia bacterium]
MSLERIEITPFAVIAGEVLQQRRTGYLSILKGTLRKVLYFSQGELIMSVSAAPEDSLPDYLVRRGVTSTEDAARIFGADPDDAVGHLHEAGVMDLSARQTLLRDWLTSQVIPLFSLDEGTAVFTEDEALPPEKRVFLQSTATLYIEGIRSITNGLVLRRSLGDLKRTIHTAREPRFTLETLPLTEQERGIAAALAEPTPIEVFLRRFASQSVLVAKVVIAMMTLGMFTVYQERAMDHTAADSADMQRDLELLAAIGSADQRSLRAVAFSRQLATLDHYQVLDVPRAATRAQIVTAHENVKKAYDPATFPPIVRESLMTIHRRLDEAMETLSLAARRAEYDKLINARRGEGAASIQQRLTQRSIADQNFGKAQELANQGDFYGAIVLLRQCVHFVPDHADAWALLGACQERNPRWRRDAAESFQMALSIDPNNVDAMISLGDLYRAQGMISRAQTCYEDVIKISPENQQAKSRLTQLKQKK